MNNKFLLFVLLFIIPNYLFATTNPPTQNFNNHSANFLSAKKGICNLSGVNSKSIAAALANSDTAFSYAVFTKQLNLEIASFIGYKTNGSASSLVKLIMFDAETVKKTVVISWTTSQEINSNYFIVQHSIDRINWTAIATKTAAGTSNSNIDYQFTDSSPIVGTNTYRIMQVDKNGSAIFSSMRDVFFGVNNDLSVTPNPANGTTTISFPQGNYNALNKLSVLNTKGVLIKEVTTREQYYKLNTSSLSKGLYFINVLNGKNLSTQKLLVL